MKKLVLILMLIAPIISFSQIGGERTDTWFDFPNNQTLNSPRTIRVQHNLFVDPLGKAPNGRGGRHFGYEFTAIMGGIYVAPSISWFPQLEDGYMDIVGTVGINWHMFRTTLIRYYSGFRMGGEWRETKVPHPILGFSLGADIKIYTFPNDSSIHLGAEVWSDWRASQHPQFYGGSDGNIRRDNGKLKVGFRF
jgi:hypothetical protein